MPHVTSRDGTSIAYEKTGSGPPLVLVHGTSTLRPTWASIFEEHFTVFAMERRGRGNSGDHVEYAIEREFDDVAAVVAATGARALLLGHSFGGLCALGSALNIRTLYGLVLYEPGFSMGERLYSQEQVDDFQALLNAGRDDLALRTFMSNIVGIPEEEVELMAASPVWAKRVATAPTVPRELAAEESFRLPEAEVASLSIPVLLLYGSDSPEELTKGVRRLSEMLPNSRMAALEGQQHVAMYTAPHLLVEQVVDFWNGIGTGLPLAAASETDPVNVPHKR